MYSNLQYEILQAIANNDYEQASVIGANFNDEFRYVNGIYNLIEKGLVGYCPDQTKEQYISHIDRYNREDYSFSLLYHVYLTEDGHSVLDRHDDHLLRLDLLQKDCDFAKSQCDSLKEAIELYRSDLESATKEANFAKATSLISIAISIIAIIAPLLYG